jgi:hypothetical protein
MSYKSWVRTGTDPKFYTNAVAYETEAEAEAAGRELASRWLLVVEWEARPSDEEVNYRFNFETDQPERII